MSFQYMPLYTGDYLRDTRFLTPLKHGIYLLALVHCWDSKGPMPLDEQECAGICNCRSADEIEALRYILGRFFVKNEYGHFNVRIQKEIDRSEAISGARSEAGKKGYEAKAKQLLNKSQAPATTISPSPSLPLSQNTETPTVFADKASPSRPPDCPTAEILTRYHEHCPMLPRVEVVNDSRKRAMSARWREVVTDPEIRKAESPRDAALEWFDWFFGHVAKSAFLTGKSKDWHADFDFLMTPTKFAKVVEGSYHREHS